MRKVLPLVVVALGTAGCDSSTAPKNYSFAGVWVSRGAFFLDVTQTGTHVSGMEAWPSTAGPYNPVSGTVVNNAVSFTVTDESGITNTDGSNGSGQFTGLFTARDTVVGTMAQSPRTTVLTLTRRASP
jgi:hypothetical protein